MNFIIACDLEGIHGVVGEEYKTLTASFDYGTAIEGACLEINTAVRALFDHGAERVFVWDNHGANKNIDFSKIDPRAIRADGKSGEFRWDFAKDQNIAGVIFLGYHAKEGTPNGVLAHTFSSQAIQYVKLNGEAIGELYVDTRICASYGIKPLFHAGDAASVAEMRAVCPTVATVVTKYGQGRNSAVFRQRRDVLFDIYNHVCHAVAEIGQPYAADFPQKAHVEIRYTRAERAANRYALAQQLGVAVAWGEDTHVLHFEITEPKWIPKLL